MAKTGIDAKDACWELLILDADPGTAQLGCLTAGDLDRDGNVEIITGGACPEPVEGACPELVEGACPELVEGACPELVEGKGRLLWYRPATFERGVIADVQPHVGVVLEDVDGDGVREVVVGYCIEPGACPEADRGSVAEGATKEEWMISWFDPGEDLHQPWTQHVIDPLTSGGPHDVLFADVDGDGEMELIANAMYCEVPGLFIYKRGADVTQPWKKHRVQEGFSGEGTVVADLDGDGRVEIISGPYLYTCLPEGLLAGLWKQSQVAPGFREMCRVALVDVTGNGRLDVVMVESEYPDGRMSWFENRLLEDPGAPWIEHLLERPLNFAHSLCAWHDRDSGEVCVFVAEMAQGGWNPPYNWDARLLQFSTADGGKTWWRELVYQGAGTHEATVCDVDGDGVMEFVGKEWLRPRVQIWKRREAPSPLTRFRHHFLDREKPYVGTDILATDVDGDGLSDVVCAAWWYKNPTWERREIPGICQIHTAYDIDGDGRSELIATKAKPGAEIGYPSLTSEFCWLKPVDPVNGKWEEYPIGIGNGDWPHGTAVAPVLPGGKLALIAGYHSAKDAGDLPEIFEVPDDPRDHPWPKRTLAAIPYGEEFVPYDLDGDGKLDVVAGRYWLENLGDGTFRPYQVVAEGFDNVARVRVADVNGNGRPDIVVVEEGVDWNARESFFVRVAWFENPGDPRTCPWKVHVVDTVRCPHSLDVADLDGDGELELVVGEHDPFKPYRNRCRLYVYKKAEPLGRAWYRYPLDDRFEHHDGTKVFELAPGRSGIVSHAWMDPHYVHLWEAM